MPKMKFYDGTKWVELDSKNADTVGGKLPTDFAAANHTHSEYAPATHNHDNLYYTEAEVNNLLAGKLSTTGKAADSELLDGLDSTAFARSSHTHTEYASATHNHDGSYVNITGDTMSGKLITKKTGGAVDNVLYGNGQIEVQSNGTDVASIGFHRPGHTGIALYHDGDMNYPLKLTGSNGLRTSIVTHQNDWGYVKSEGEKPFDHDWNVVTENGIYRTYPGASTHASTPAGAYQYGTLVVTGYGNSVTQSYYSHTTDSPIWTRTKWNTSDWTSWSPSASRNYVDALGTHVRNHGIGDIAKDISGLDLNDAGRKTGFFMGSGMVNAPSTNWHYVENIRHNDLWAKQVAYDFFSETMYQRRQHNGSWQPWRRIDVTSGSNSNGQFIRFPDGTQICYMDRYYSTTGASYYSQTDQVFPAAFASGSPTVLNVTAYNNYNGYSVGNVNSTYGAPISTTAFRWGAQWNAGIPSGYTVTARVMAIGWY